MILVDSDILIAHLRGYGVAKDWLLRVRRDTGQLAISVVVITEVAGGMRSHERRQVLRLLASMRVFPVNDRIGWRAAELMRTYRSSHPGIGVVDYIIGATAQVEGLDLATLNVKHFPMYPHLSAPFGV